MQRQLELPPDVRLVDGAEVKANLFRSENAGPLAGLADEAGCHHHGGIDRHQLRFNRVIENLLYHVAKLHGRLNPPVVPLAVDQGLHVQGVHILEGLFSEGGEDLISPDSAECVFGSFQRCLNLFL